MSIVDTVIQSLIQNLTPLVVDEVSLLCGVKGQMESLEKELKFINIFLKNSVGKRNDDIVKEVVNQIRDVAYKAEDVFDMYIAKVSEQESRCLLKKLFHIIGRIKMLHGVGVDIGEIKSSIDEIYKNKEKYNIGKDDFKSKDDDEVEQSLRRRRRNVDEEDVMHDSTVVIKELEKMGSHRTVVSIIGMGGLGKTTLAKKIYNTNRIKDLFPCRAWGDVSNDYRPKELLLTILNCVGDSSKYKDLSEDELKKKVRECLEGKKYLIVLDDIWETTVWDDVRDAFPGDSGGRILITSRKKEVATHTRATSTYELPFLNNEDSWKLFSRKVFQEEEECPSDLVEVGKSMVEGCGGLPLAIIVLAGIATKKKSQREWLRIKEHVNWHLAQETIVKDILNLSYDNLPQRLKPCFLYFAIYPEDREIWVEELIQLWIAEGFIQVTEHLNPPKLEDVAEDYLDELVELSLVQVAKRRRSDGSVKTCRIHDLLRDLCISESRDEKFLDVCKGIGEASSNPRRLSCQCIEESCIITSNNNGYQSCIRSFICFGERYDTKKYTMESLAKRFKLARVLDFGRIAYKVPNGLKTLIHLRYLRIRVGSSGKGHNKDTLACVFCLCNLHVLKIEGLYSPETISSGMWKLKRLRHLYTDLGFKLIADMPKPEREIMSNLQTLGWVDLDQQTPSILNNDRFPNLIKLSLTVLDVEAFQRLSHLSNLRTLKIKNTANLPSNDSFLSNLTKITLENMKEFKLGTFQKLTKLQTLTLRFISSYGELNINFVAGDFPNLKVFKIHFVRLTNWRLGEGVMPHLEFVVIRQCRSLEGLPEELWSLTTLQKVEIEDPSPQIDKSLKDGMVMKNGCKIIIIK